MKILFYTLSLLFSMSVIAQSTGTIAGKLTDLDFNNEPLAFANVLIKGTTTGTTSDIDGLYIFENLDPGDYTLVFSFVGYDTKEIPVTVEAGKVTEVNVPMSASTASLDEVVITTTTRKESEVALLMDQKKAVEIKQSIGAEELTRKGVGDAAAAVAKISGISKQQSSSDVYVRGLGDRYQNTTMNNLTLPSTDVSKKNINLDLFTTDIIENVGVSKAYTSGFYGDFAAGNVNITSKAYTGKGFLSVSLGSGVNTSASGKDFVRNEGVSYFGYYNRYDNNPFAVVLSHPVDPEEANAPINFNGSFQAGTSINFDEDTKLSFFGSASFSNGYEFREGVARDFTNVLKVDFPNIEEYEYKTNTTALLNIDFKIDNSNKLKVRSLFINEGGDEVGYYGTKGEGYNRDGIASEDPNDLGFFVTNSRFSQNMVFVNQLLGEHQLNQGWSTDWGFGYNRVYADEPDRKRFSVENYQYALDNDPNTNPIFYTNIPFDNQRFFQSIDDNEYNGFVDFTKEFSENFKLKFGYNGRWKERVFSSVRYGYEIIDRDNTPIVDINNLDEIFNYSNITTVYNTVALNAISNQIGNKNVPGLPEATYKGQLFVYAGHLSAEWNAGEKLLIVPGIRVENFKQKIRYDVINIREDDPGMREVSETVFLPSLNFRYALNDDSNLRLALSKTMSLPEFKEVAPFVYEDVTVRIGGNPDLIGGINNSGVSYSNIYNAELKYEWFMKEGEIFSIGVFGKRIDDPVNRVVAADATGTQRYFRTGDKAEVYGAELELKKNLLTRESDEAVLALGFNASYLNTKQDLKTTTGTFTTSFDRSSDKLEGASDWVLNADFTYTPLMGEFKPRFTLVGSYFSDRIYSLGSGSLGNIVEKSVPSLDFVWNNPITDNFEINVSASNLLNPDISLVREGTEFGDITIYKYKVGVTAGVSLKYSF
ncbi:TonB-dependent receptor [Aegicerativicinus sediminis]